MTISNLFVFYFGLKAKDWNLKLFYFFIGAPLILMRQKIITEGYLNAE